MPRLAVIDDQAVAVADARVQAAALAVEVFFEEFDQFARLGGGDLAGAVIDHGLVFILLLVRKGDEVAAQGHVGIFQIDADGDRLEGRAAGVAGVRVVPHHRKVGNVAARLEPRGHGAAKPDLRALCQGVDVRLSGRLQGRLAAQLFEGPIGHAVAQNYDVFHVQSPVYFLNGKGFARGGQLAAAA